MLLLIDEAPLSETSQPRRPSAANYAYIHALTPSRTHQHALVISYHEQNVDLRITILPTNSVTGMDEMHWQQAIPHQTFTELVTTNHRTPRREVPPGKVGAYFCIN